MADFKKGDVIRIKSFMGGAHMFISESFGTSRIIVLNIITGEKEEISRDSFYDKVYYNIFDLVEV